MTEKVSVLDLTATYRTRTTEGCGRLVVDVPRAQCADDTRQTLSLRVPAESASKMQIPFQYVCIYTKRLHVVLAGRSHVHTLCRNADRCTRAGQTKRATNTLPRPCCHLLCERASRAASSQRWTGYTRSCYELRLRAAFAPLVHRGHVHWLGGGKGHPLAEVGLRTYQPGGVEVRRVRRVPRIGGDGSLDVLLKQGGPERLWRCSSVRDLGVP